MPISFSTSRLTSDHKKTHAPNGAQTVEELADFDVIKKTDLEVGTSVVHNRQFQELGLILQNGLFYMEKRGF